MTTDDKTTILILDCDKESILLLEEMIKILLTNYQILSTSYGKEAISLCSQQRISLIFSEIKLKDMNGLELIRKINNQYPGIPIIIQTATVTDNIEQMAKEACCNGCLTKPIDLDALSSKINEHLEST